ncbi:hypothetical protein [Actinomadura rubrisoli]|uniref:DUF3618 domain-containing protein n=1 Tax=Actinomadura rubrisoli TaxID=2530368 RepID=A0A4R5BQV1_9ACTN|nr:hypothetical protein [Actinomadura rubrisoli]TDD88349.1 hypothetical protein E1298_15165 [Actinomadura rubrisoli]
MADDNSTIAWRLDRIEEALRDLGLRVVSADLYTRDRTEIERRLAEIERDIAEERLARKEADKDLADRMDKGGANWRQALFSGVVPGVFFVITLAVTILLALRGGK